MPTGTVWPYADRLAKGKLAIVIREMRAGGQSCERVARGLHKKYGIDVTRETVRQWERQLDAEDERATTIEREAV